MIYEEIAFDKVKDWINDIFPAGKATSWNLLPEDIHTIAAQSNILLNWQVIDWWHEFEYGEDDIDESKFFRLLPDFSIYNKQKLIIITDRCFSSKKAFCIEAMEFKNFIEDIYPEIYNEIFFQPFDLILFLADSRILIIIHHEGAITKYSPHR